MRLFLLSLVLVLASGCVMNPFGSTSGTAEPLPGTAIGTFAVSALESANTCGAGALGETPSWSFTLSMSKDGSSVYWDSGSGPITGILAADGVGFSFANAIITDMRPPPNLDPETNGGIGGGGPIIYAPPCSIERDDTAYGAFSSSVDPVLGFVGSLNYVYTPTAGSNCTDLITGTTVMAPTFLTLPCSMSFNITGTRE